MMNPRNWILTALIFCLCVNIARAHPPTDTVYHPLKDTNQFFRRLTDYSRKLMSLECSFTQVKTMQMLKDPSVSMGCFYYRNGDQVRWEYLEPFSYVLVISGGVMKMKDEKRTREVSMNANPLLLELNKNLSSFISGILLLEKKDFARQFFENDYFYKAELLPVSKRMKKYFSNISLILDKTDLSIAGLDLKEKNGDLSRFSFTRKKINKPIPDEKFIIR